MGPCNLAVHDNFRTAQGASGYRLNARRRLGKRNQLQRQLLMADTHDSHALHCSTCPEFTGGNDLRSAWTCSSTSPPMIADQSVTAALGSLVYLKPIRPRAYLVSPAGIGKSANPLRCRSKASACEEHRRRRNTGATPELAVLEAPSTVLEAYKPCENRLSA